MKKPGEIEVVGRRTFLKRGVKVTLAAGLLGTAAISGCKEEEDKKVSPPEDLMQEHGILNRVMLIYDACRIHLTNKESFPMEAISNTAAIVKTFIEDYHEKQEEDYLFPRFEKKGELVGLVSTLKLQHNAGRTITSNIIELCKNKKLTDTQNSQLIVLLNDFSVMFRPHEAREDTVLFPAFRKIVTKHEYDSLGEEFENNEHKHFGEDGFEHFVDKIGDIEKSLGIYDLSQFTRS